MALRPCDLVMRDEALSIDEEAIGVLVEHGLVEVVACECADGVQRVPEAHRHELGAVAVLPAQDVVAAVAGRLASRAPAGALHVVQVCVRVLRPSPPAPRSGDHADATGPLAGVEQDAAVRTLGMSGAGRMQDLDLLVPRSRWPAEEVAA